MQEKRSRTERSIRGWCIFYSWSLFSCWSSLVVHEPWTAINYALTSSLGFPWTRNYYFFFFLYCNNCIFWIWRCISSFLRESFSDFFARLLFLKLHVKSRKECWWEGSWRQMNAASLLITTRRRLKLITRNRRKGSSSKNQRQIYSIKAKRKPTTDESNQPFHTLFHSKTSHQIFSGFSLINPEWITSFETDRLSFDYFHILTTISTACCISS